MQYKTNQLDKNVLFSNENYQNITQDFWVYEFAIDAKKVGYQYSLIDEIKQQLKGAKSVVYLASKAFYALFDKSQFKNEFELEAQIEKLITNTDEVKYREITNLRDDKEIDKRHLAQLLFNSLANTSTKNANCSNITGGLYWIVKADSSKDKKSPNQNIVWQYITIKLELDYHLHLKLEVKTFTNLLKRNDMDFTNRKAKFEDYPQYEILPDNLRTMRRLRSDEISKKNNATYINIQYKNNGSLRKNTVPFLDFSDWDSFETSKSGVLYLFLKEIKEQISKYITIKFIELPFSLEKTEFDKELSGRVKAKIKAFYQNRPIIINIAESLKNDQAANDLAKNLQTFLTDQEREYKIQEVKIGDLYEDALNIRIIRNKKHYEANTLEDEHCNKYQNGTYKNYLVHHITTDDFDIELEKTKKGEIKKLLASPAIDVILKESYIKNDIRQGKITILDWNLGEWLFMGKAESKNKSEALSYSVLKIDSNGALIFESSENGRFNTEEYNHYVSIYEMFDKFNGREFLNCLLVSNDQDVNVIFETPRFTIQDIETIGKTLESEDKDDDKFLTQTNIITIVNDFIKSPSFKEKDRESLDKLIILLKEYKAYFSKKELLNFFGKEKANLSNKGENHLQVRFCKFYQEQTGDVLKSFFRGKLEKEELLSSRLDIFYEVNESQTEAFYFVGESSNNPKNPINSSFQNATNIRKIKAVKNLAGQQSKLVFDQLLQTMAVDFVKQGNLTVLPFPFKYLREIVK